MSVYISDYLKSIANILHFIPKLFNEDVSVSLADTEKFIKVYNHPNMPLNADVGSPIPKGGAIAEALQTKNIVVKELAKEVYGVAFTSYAIPIKDEQGEIVGFIALGKSQERKNELLQHASNLSASLQQIGAAVQQMTAGLQEVISVHHDILQEANKARESTDDTDEIIKFVENISKQTNILGLNASIEAARAGSAGRGFNVVAEEIRKLSASTSNSIKQVDEILGKVELAVEIISDKVSNSNEFFEAQSSALEEINASIQELNAAAQFLEQLSRKL